MNIITVFFNAMPGTISQGLIWGMIAIGIFITFKVLNVADLTVDGTVSLGAATTIVFLKLGMPNFITLPMAFIAGLLAGFITGVLTTKCKIPMILSGILTQLSLYSINLRIMEGRANMPVNADKYNLLVSSRNIFNFELSNITKNPILILTLMCILLIAILYWFFGTEIGSAIRATGDNSRMACAQGINTDANVIFGLMLSNAIVSFAGGLLAEYQGFSDVNMGRGAIVIGLAACIIGEVLFSKIAKNFAMKLLAVIFGAIIYYIVIQIVLQMGLITNDLKLFTAIIVAIFLSMPQILKKSE